MPHEKPISALAMCTYCSWRARMTGDTVLEVATFLRQLVLQHVDERHPGIDPPQVVVERES